MDANHKRRKPEAYPAHRDVSLERRPQKVRYYTYGDSLHMLYYTYIILNFGQCYDHMRTKCMLLIIYIELSAQRIKL